MHRRVPNAPLAENNKIHAGRRQENSAWSWRIGSLFAEAERADDDIKYYEATFGGS